MHGPVCVLCGYINEEQAESCTADHYTADDSSHKEICGACGGVIKEESHLYTYTTETAEDGVRIHKEPVPCVGIQWMAHVYLIRTVSVRSVVNPVHMNTPSGKVLMNPIISWSVKFCGHTEKKSTKLANLQTVKNIAPLAVIP